MSDVLGFFLTWTCKGTWLHGDARGSVDDANNIPGRPYLESDLARQTLTHSMLKHEPFVLSNKGREIVDATVRKHCAIGSWILHEVNVRTNHVHVVLTCRGGVHPDDAMEQLKAWATRNLRAAKLCGKDEKPWTEHGSTRWIDSPESLAAAIDYVRNQQ